MVRPGMLRAFDFDGTLAPHRAQAGPVLRSRDDAEFFLLHRRGLARQLAEVLARRRVGQKRLVRML